MPSTTWSSSSWKLNVGNPHVERYQLVKLKNCCFYLVQEKKTTQRMHTKSVIYYKFQQKYAVSCEIQVHCSPLNEHLHFQFNQICNSSGEYQTSKVLPLSKMEAIQMKCCDKRWITLCTRASAHLDLKKNEIWRGLTQGVPFILTLILTHFVTYNIFTYENFNTSNKLQNKSQYHISKTFLTRLLPRESNQCLTACRKTGMRMKHSFHLTFW